MTALLWTFPLLMFASIVIGWAAEVTAVHLSAGVALALLAWLQTAPEFAVEATIAWHRNAHLALANLTGSLRLLLGFGWPGVYLIYWFGQRKRDRKRPRELLLPVTFATEAAGLAVPVVYFSIIWLKGTWTLWDGLILCACYLLYFLLLFRQRKVLVPDGATHDLEEEEPWVVRKVTSLGSSAQLLATLGMFAFGAFALWFTVHPFLEGLKSAAVSLGVSEFIFIQWIAPIASEFPEKVTAFGWARKPSKVPMAIVNMLSSVTSQWTLLAGLVPVIFSLSAHEPYTITFDGFQRGELLLTIGQSLMAVVMLADLKITEFEMIGFFLLWAAQFFAPSLRHYLVPVYFFWSLTEIVRLALRPEDIKAWRALKKVISF